MVGEVIIPPAQKLEDLIRLADLCVDLLRQNEEFYAEVNSKLRRTGFTKFYSMVNTKLCRTGFTMFYVNMKLRRNCLHCSTWR